MQNFPNLLKLNSVCDLQTSDIESDTCNAVLRTGLNQSSIPLGTTI